EFSTIPHMKEDVIEFLLNIKALRLRPTTWRAGKLTLEVEGEGRILAGDIEPSADFEVVNPDLHLATLDSPDAKLIVEFNVEQGKGYVPAGQGDGLPIGVIPVDAIFTPIRKVNYTVEPTRVGQATGYERLILEVWTDGTISAIEAVSKSAQMLIEKFQLFYELAYVPQEAVEKYGLPISLEQYNTPIEQLGLSVRTFNCLKRAGITKVGELLERNDEELLKIRNLGRKALEEVRKQLKAKGFASEEEIPQVETALEQGGEEEDP
ncbi:MAG: DNA-directed RNA polymerase subunit alpha, partial [Dehalococcoidia bacterium]|nr:DNA-directed RNA polymerase subunit alpha [Dehalococcoidia bacterium]